MGSSAAADNPPTTMMFFARVTKATKERGAEKATWLLYSVAGYLTQERSNESERWFLGCVEIALMNLKVLQDGN